MMAKGSRISDVRKQPKPEKVPRLATYRDLFGSKLSVSRGAAGAMVRIEHFDVTSVSVCAASPTRLRRLRKVLLAAVAMVDYLLAKLERAKGVT